jgi:hypothetical protein
MKNAIALMSLVIVAAISAPVLAQYQVGPVYPQKPSNIGGVYGGPGGDLFYSYNGARYDRGLEFVPAPFVTPNDFQGTFPYSYNGFNAGEGFNIGQAPFNIYGPVYGAGPLNVPFPAQPAPFVAPTAPPDFSAPSQEYPAEMPTGEDLSVSSLPKQTQTHPTTQPMSATPATQPAKR